jgi:hypothetical protein
MGETNPLRPQRPGIVTFVGVVIYIQAILAAVAAILMMAFHGRLLETLSGAIEVTSGALWGAAIAEALLAVLLLAVGAGVMRGSRGWRLFVLIVETLSVASAAWEIVFGYQGSLIYRAIVTFVFGIFVIWALYGNDRARSYFEAA